MEIEYLRAVIAQPVVEAPRLLSLATSEDFYAPHLRTIFEHISQLVAGRMGTAEQNKPLNPIALRTSLQLSGGLLDGSPLVRILPELVCGFPASRADIAVLGRGLRTNRARRAFATTAAQLDEAARTGDIAAMNLAMQYTAWIQQLPAVRELQEHSHTA